MFPLIEAVVVDDVTLGYYDLTYALIKPMITFLIQLLRVQDFFKMRINLPKQFVDSLNYLRKLNLSG